MWSSCVLTLQMEITPTENPLHREYILSFHEEQEETRR
jgi:hypothetical protein